MTQGPRLRSGVLAAKERLIEDRDALWQRHAEGASGVEVSAALADLLDAVALDLFDAALADLGEDGPGGLRSEVALVPHGGYGRRDVAPYSDVDLMILHSPAAAARVAPLAQRMLQDLFDAGLMLGQSARTPVQACQLARKDPIVWTSLVEARYLAGSAGLFAAFFRRFQKQAQRRSAGLIAAVEKARGEERLQYGETVYLLEPNVKRSRGGLRDIQLIRWIGFARYGAADLQALLARGALLAEDEAVLAGAAEFLLRLRNEMHFHARKSIDNLDRAEQVRLAAAYGYAGDAGLLPVEQFMREYFRLTEAASQIATRFAANSRRGPRWGELLAPLFSHQFERDFRIGPAQITANPRGLAKLRGDPAEILRLADLANLYDKPIARATCEAIRQAVPGLPDEVSPETSSRFISLLSQGTRLGELLRSLHEMGVLEKIIPAFGHARCLLQFNEYHKYTVDEHSLRAVEQATDFQRDEGPLGLVYRHIKKKWLLHLALLLHDLGKGYEEDHSEVGLRIAHETAARLGLSQADSETLAFLVHKHLMMSHLAFRRDTSDNQLVLSFAVEVGSPEVMQMLFVLTAADLAAVGPGVLNAWKVEVLADLHRRAMQHLAGQSPAINSEEFLQKRRDDVLAALDGSDEAQRKWFETQLAAAPYAYLQSSSPERVIEDLAPLRSLAHGEVRASGRYQPDTKTVEYKVGAHEDIAPGVFHKLAGALAARGLQILSAEIHTLAEGLIFDRFFVHDPDFAGEPPPGRIEEVCRALAAALRDPGAKPAFRRVWRAGPRRGQAPLPASPTRVRIDNSTSERFTILDVFAADRTGLLYAIGRSLFGAGLSVAVAKIGTYLDQVVDVFYVTDREGRKILDEARLAEIRERLLRDLEEFEREEAGRARGW
ncbi:MAG TPA: [protein-PII] uridylyltransferase [Pirellulales bacterium]|nr:[protein-PII] uridylyltransferase [Pirellulales bacterium]